VFPPSRRAHVTLAPPPAGNIELCYILNDPRPPALHRHPGRPGLRSDKLTS